MFIAEEPREARSELHARALALRLSETHDAVIAFSRTGDPLLGDWYDASVIARYGELPDEAVAVAG
ncbi:MAG TPA: hypothetical protein VGM83_16110 [Devosiaceae bacterium]|jgi:hypothetical protein